MSVQPVVRLVSYQRDQYADSSDEPLFRSNIDAPHQFPPDPARAYVILLLSEEEYTRLASSVDIGAAIGYGDESVQIMNSIIPVGDLCDRIADCIDNPDSEARRAVQDAAAQVIAGGNPFQPGQPADALDGDAELLGTMGPGCDYDAVWGACISVVEQMHQNAEDFFDEIELLIEQKDQAKLLISKIPALAGKSAQVAIDTAVNITETLIGLYRVQYTDNLRDDFACQLFCSVKDSCALTIADVFNALAGLVPTVTDFADAFTDADKAIELLSTVSALTGGAAVYFIWGMQLGLGNTLNSLFDTTLANLIVNVRLSEPSNNWSTLCACAGAWTEEFLFDQSAGGWTVPGAPGRGVYTPGVGFTTTYTVSGGMSVFVQRLFTPAPATRVTSVTMYYETTNVDYSSPDGARIRLLYQNSVVALQQTQAQIGVASLAWTGDVQIDEITLDITVSLFNQYYGKITRCVISGTGPNPF